MHSHRLAKYYDAVFVDRGYLGKRQNATNYTASIQRQTPIPTSSVLPSHFIQREWQAWRVSLELKWAQMRHPGLPLTQAASGWGFYLLTFIGLWDLELTVSDGLIFSVILFLYITKREVFHNVSLSHPRQWRVTWVAMQEKGAFAKGASAKLGDRKNGFFKMGSLLLNREHRPHKITRWHIQEAPYYNGRRAARRANLCSTASPLSQLGLVGSKVCTRQIWLRVMKRKEWWGRAGKCHDHTSAMKQAIPSFQRQRYWSATSRINPSS